MNSALVGISTILGLVLGVGGAFFLLSRQKKKEQKIVLKQIEKQDAKLGANQTPTDFFRKPKPEVKKVKKVEKKPKKVRAKKTKAKKKVKKK